MRKARIDGGDSVLWRAVAAALREAGIAVEFAAASPADTADDDGHVLIIGEQTLERDEANSPLSTRTPGSPPLLLVAAELSEDQALKAMEANVEGLVLLDSPGDALTQCFREVANGGRWIDQQAMQAALDGALRGKGSATSALTRREQQIADFCAEGRTTKQIAEALDLAIGTIKVHFHNIYKKLGVSGRNELTRLLLSERIK